MNNAGVMPLSEFNQGRVKEWEQTIDVNLKGTLYGFDVALPVMRKQKSGHFVNVASISAHISGAASGVYAASKFGVWAASEALRQEEAIAKSNVRVTVISPGAIDTELPKSVKAENYKGNIDKFYEDNAIPAEEVARAIKFSIDTSENTAINEIVMRPSGQVL